MNQRFDDSPGTEPGCNEQLIPSTPEWNGGQILRFVGGAMLVASFSTFLIRRWDAYSDVVRYAIMLAHTLLLVVSALFCSLGMRENRGARTLLVLTLAAVPFNVAILAGFIYSRHCWDDASVAKPTSFLWVAHSETALLTMLAVALPILVASAWLALRALVRSQSQPTLALFALSNALLLAPVRAPAVSTIVFIVASLALAILDESHFARIAAFGTREGRLVRVVLATPLFILLGRTLFLYPNFLLVVGAIGIAGGVWLAVSARRGRRTIERHALTLASLLVSSFGWLSFWFELVNSVPLPTNWQLPSLLLPWAVLLEATARVTQLESRRPRVVAALAVSMATVLQLIVFPSSTVELYVAVTGVLVLLLGIGLHSKLYVVSGGAALLAALVHQLTVQVRFEYLSHWLFLSLTGVGLILVASYLERHQGRLRQGFRGLLEQSRTWDY